MEPPLPPKNEMNQAPVPPPRRNKRNTRVGTPNANNQVKSIYMALIFSYFIHYS